MSKGIGSKYADLLEAAGVDTVPELAQRKAENLTSKLIAVNEVKKLVRKLPVLSLGSIAQACFFPSLTGLIAVLLLQGTILAQ